MSTKLFIPNILKRRQQMSKDKKLNEIKNLCESIMSQWGTTSINNDPWVFYVEGKMVGRSVLAQTILEIINNG